MLSRTKSWVLHNLVSHSHNVLNMLKDMSGEDQHVFVLLGLELEMQFPSGSIISSVAMMADDGLLLNKQTPEFCTFCFLVSIQLINDFSMAKMNYLETHVILI